MNSAPVSRALISLRECFLSGIVTLRAFSKPHGTGNIIQMKSICALVKVTSNSMPPDSTSCESAAEQRKIQFINLTRKMEDFLGPDGVGEKN